MVRAKSYMVPIEGAIEMAMPMLFRVLSNSSLDCVLGWHAKGKRAASTSKHGTTAIKSSVWIPQQAYKMGSWDER